MANKKSAVYVFDMDEVLVDISYEVYRRIKSNWVIFSNYLVDTHYTTRNIHARDHFYVNYNMLKPDITDEELEELNSHIDQLVFSGDYYESLFPTKLARGTLMNPAFMNSSNVKKVFILTRYTTDDLMESKKKFIKKYFDHDKIGVLYVPRNDKKSDFLKDHNIDWDVIVDDELTNIWDFALEFDLKGREFLIPEFGYNKMTTDLALLIEGKGGIISYYDPTINQEIERKG